MAVYVDRARNKFGRMIMSHMVADSTIELWKMADAIGMRREWFQRGSFPHYDVSVARRTKALALGAVEVDRRELAQFMRRKRATCGHSWSQGRDRQTGSWCLDCGIKVMEVHDRPCGECRHCKPVIGAHICKPNLMAITPSMLVTYYLVPGPGRYGLCFEGTEE
jgi:hypothetical protein